MSNELYVLCETDSEGNVIGFVTGGGSSSPAFIRAYETPASARRALQRINFKPEHSDVIRFEEAAKLYTKGDVL